MFFILLLRNLVISKSRPNYPVFKLDHQSVDQAVEKLCLIFTK